MPELISTIVRIAEVAIGFGMLIFIHELGHFLMCKRVGVRVEKFSLGFGPVLVGFKRGDTHYVLSAIPLGGFVKMSGENPGEEKTGEPWEYHSKPPGARAKILLAGVGMNFLVAFILAPLIFLVGVEEYSSAIGFVDPGSPAWDAGLRQGDRITAVNGKPVQYFQDAVMRIMIGKTSGIAHVEVLRNGERHEFEMSVGKNAEIDFLPLITMEINGVLSDSEAEEAGFLPGDKIIAVDGTPITYWETFSDIVKRSPGRSLTVTVQRSSGEESDLRLVPRPMDVWQSGVAQQAKITLVVPGSPAESAGLKNGDLVTAIDGVPLTDWESMVEIVRESAGKQITLSVIRDNETLQLSATPERADGGRGMLGVYPDGDLPLIVGNAKEESGAFKAGIIPGDELVRIGKRKVRSWGDIDAAFANSDGEPVSLTIRRDDKESELSVSPYKATIGLAGITPMGDSVTRRYGLLRAIPEGLEESARVVSVTYVTLWRMVTGRISMKNVAGPVGIMQLSYRLTNRGLVPFIRFLLLISINLAVINLVPIPILDGGHLLFIIVEKIKGSPVSEKVLMTAQYIGLATIIAIFVLVTRNDVIRLFW